MARLHFMASHNLWGSYFGNPYEKNFSARKFTDRRRSKHNGTEVRAMNDALLRAAHVATDRTITSALLLASGLFPQKAIATGSVPQFVCRVETDFFQQSP